jgi:hypothetical protein
VRNATPRATPRRGSAPHQMGGIPSRLNLRDTLSWASRIQNDVALCSKEETMITFSRRTLALLPAIAPLLSAEFARAGAIELNPAAVAFQTSEQIKWSEPSPNGARSAVLVGDPTKEGLYVQMVKWLGGDHFSRPHFHPNDRFITVLGGTWWVGTGTKFDPEATLPMGPGAFVTHFGKQVHFDGAKEEDATLLIVGLGPATSTPAEAK